MQLEEFTKLITSEIKIDGSTITPTLKTHFSRPFYPGLGDAVARRTYLRPGENWADLCDRVTLGNFSLNPYAHLVGFEKHAKSRSSEPFTDEMVAEKRFQLILKANNFNRLMKKGVILTSGRHQQHGDLTQSGREMMVYTNCSTAASTSVMFYLLLCGSGVGRSYDDDLMVTDWRNCPKIYPVLDIDHPDNDGTRWNWPADDVRIDHFINVEDSREGWAQALMQVESFAYSGSGKDKNILMNFSQVRPNGSPIAGMQNKPSSGPIPMMESFLNLNKIIDLAKLTDMPLWEQAMRVDHVFAECVLFGGARRSARMSTKWYKDADIERFITIKNLGGFWSSNNSVTVDNEFWEGVDKQDHHCLKVLRLLTHNAYFQNSGEPGIINVDKLADSSLPDNRKKEDFKVGNDKFQLTPQLKRMYDRLFDIVKEKKYKFITNPCGEVSQHVLGAFCVIFDICMANADGWGDLLQAALLAPEFLFGVNQMESIYQYEVALTNRIGIGLTGIHEFAAKEGLTFRHLIDANATGHKLFWANIHTLKQRINEECERLALLYNVAIPVTNTTIKPSGSVSKPWNCTEGAHLPPALYWLRWVQYDKNNPLIQEYIQRGYPVQTLKSYPNTVIVGFPTKSGMLDLLPESDVVLAGQATIDEQYAWVKLIEENWLDTKGQQVSYTCKYDPRITSYDELYESIRINQRNVKCFTIMPQIDQSAYEYQPEELISKLTYDGWIQHIEARHKAANLDHIQEDIDLEGLVCAGGACPIM